MYNSVDGKQYDPKKDTLRDMTIVEEIKEGEIIYLKHLRGEKCNADETRFVKDLAKKGYHPITNPFSK